MKPSKYLLFALLLILVNSCYKELDYDDLNFKPQIVLNGLINQDSIIEVNVGRTLSILESSGTLPFLDSAEVRLYENDLYIEDLIYDSLGMYHSTITAKANTNYRLEAGTDQIETARARFSIKELRGFHLSNINYEIRDTIISVSDISRDDISYVMEVPEEIDTSLMLIRLEFDIVFKDESEEENYYSYTNSGNFSYVINHYVDTRSYGTIKVVYLDKENNTRLFFQNSFDNEKYYPNGRSSTNGYRQGYFISDELFNGSEAKFSLRTFYYSGKLDPVEIILYSYPYDYVYFHQTGNRYVNAKDNPFSQPTNIHSNVENGVGMVCGVSVYKQSIILEREAE